MWRSPYDRSHPPPPPPPPHHGHHHRPPPPHAGMVPAHYPHEMAHHPPDPYAHHPHPAMYRPPPPAHHRYDYVYAHPPSYPPRYPPPPPPAARPYYGEAPIAPVDVSPCAVMPMLGGGCTCKKSKCLKLYCQCFSSSTTCGPKCKCQACHNTTNHREDIEEARKVILERNPSAFELKVYPPSSSQGPPSSPTPTSSSPTKSGCKCRRSFCLKKYCECFNHGAKCGQECRCVNCRNQTDAPGAGPYAKAQVPESPPSSSQSEDRMAIMAAVAMTELLGGKRNAAHSQAEEPELKRARVTPPSGDDSVEERPVVSSSSSSNASTPEPFRSSPKESPRASPVSLPAFAGHYYPYQASPNTFRPKAYEETTRLSGLPKSLSFRKICSKCGKTRGEHGELGFGHRCVYQDCGKCGAGVQMHVKASVPMGILCTLTEKAGATPGAARAYERKIKDLAVRAELQQKLQAQRNKQQQQQQQAVVTA